MYVLHLQTTGAAISSSLVKTSEDDLPLLRQSFSIGKNGNRIFGFTEED